MENVTMKQHKIDYIGLNDNIETSIKKYGLIIDISVPIDDDTYFIIYGTSQSDTGDYNSFNSSFIPTSIKGIKELYDWADTFNWTRYNNNSPETILKLIYDLWRYYGTSNIFNTHEKKYSKVKIEKNTFTLSS